jgi:uncharacterized protein (TIGR02265 family)
MLAVLRRHDRLAAYEAYFPDEEWSSLVMHPLADYLVRLGVAGALLESPERLHQGIREITRQNATAFASSLMGRVMLRILSRDPVRLTQQGLAGHRQSMNYGKWEMRRPGPREVQMIYRSEYMWIESAIAGAAAGTFESCGVTADVQTVLEDKYDGVTTIRW